MPTHIEIDAMPAGPELDELACRALGIEPDRRMVFTGVSENRTALIGHYEDNYARISADVSTAIHQGMARLPGMTLRYGVDRDGEWLARIADLSAVAEAPALAIARAIAKLGRAE